MHPHRRALPRIGRNGVVPDGPNVGSDVAGATDWKNSWKPSVQFLGWAPRSVATGAPAGASTWSARRKPARVSAAWVPRLIEPWSSGSPGTHVITVQCLGKRSDGSPNRTGVGTGSGRRGASTGSHRRSLSWSSGVVSMRCMRTTNSFPRRHIWLPQPPATSQMSSPARSGCCSRNRSRTRSAVISISVSVIRKS